MNVGELRKWLQANPHLPNNMPVRIYMPDYGTILPADVVQNTGTQMVIYGYGQQSFQTKVNIQQTGG